MLTATVKAPDTPPSSRELAIASAIMERVKQSISRSGMSGTTYGILWNDLADYDLAAIIAEVRA